METDQQLEQLLDDLSSFPAGLLDDFDLPELATSKQQNHQTVLPYGLPSSGIPPAGPHCVSIHDPSLRPNPSESVREKPRKRIKLESCAGGCNNKGCWACRSIGTGMTEAMQLIHGSGSGSEEKKKPGIGSVCQACQLVPAEVQCSDCDTVLCAFCDFETHRKAEFKQHGARVMLQVRGSDGKVDAAPKGSSTMQQLWELNGMAPKAAGSLAEETVAAKATAKVTAKVGSSALGSSDPSSQRQTVRAGNGGASLDDTILEFFKTSEFQDVISRVNKGAEDASYLSSLPSSAGGTHQRKQQAASGAAPMAVSGADSAPTTAAAVAAARETFVFQLGPDLDGEALKQWRESRLAAVSRFHAKKAYQRENPQVRYTSRKTIADSRPRVKGRFVKTAALITSQETAAS